MNPRYCTKCVMSSTRPRITFNKDGVCNACQWAEEKKILDWKKRWKHLKEICQKEKRVHKTGFNCLIPVSGGKDSSYVSYRMKHDLGMNPLCVTITPPLPKETGELNLKRFANSGYDLIAITPNTKIAQEINRFGFIEYGLPLYSWMINLQTAIHKVAMKFNIHLIMYGEEGESEYGGTSVLKNRPFYDKEYSRKIYLSNTIPEKLLNMYQKNQLYWWLYMSKKEYHNAGLKIAHWSYFENWDPYRNYVFAKEKTGLKEQKERSKGTYNNFSQTDTILYDLHTHLMYLKYGFGRCSQDVGIDIRRGALSRKQGIILAKKYDHEFPVEYVPEYLDYFDMSRKDFDAVLDTWTNKKLFNKVKGVWKPQFEII